MSVPHLGTPASRHKGRKGLVSYPSALLALACFIGFAILWLLHKEGGSPGEWLSTSTTLSPRYQTAAAANITAWKNRCACQGCYAEDAWGGTAPVNSLATERVLQRFLAYTPFAHVDENTLCFEVIKRKKEGERVTDQQ